MTEEEWRGGLQPHYDYMLTEKPEDPAMRESASIWLFEENGDFAFPRIGLEGIGAVWDTHRTDCNFAFRDGRALYGHETEGKTLDPIGADGKATILGAGGLKFECIEPYRKWRVEYDGNPIDTTSDAMREVDHKTDKTAHVKFEVDLTMVTPCWVQDNTPEKIAQMTEREADDARSMGVGYRMEHQFRAEGRLEIDGKSRNFKATGNRIHRQSVRPLDGFRGHCWQTAVFPDGRAFAFIAYPPGDDGSTYNEGYVYLDGKMYPAAASNIPFLTKLEPNGQNVAIEMVSEVGTFKIGGTSCLTTYKVMSEGEMAGFALQQGAVEYEWDGQKAYGMIERSTWLNQMQN